MPTKNIPLRYSLFHLVFST